MLEAPRILGSVSFQSNEVRGAQNSDFLLWREKMESMSACGIGEKEREGRREGEREGGVHSYIIQHALLPDVSIVHTP